MGATTHFWDSMAKRYPHYNDTSMSKDVHTVLQWAQEQGVVYEHATLLDIGAGTGTFSIPLAALHVKVTAIDPSSKMLDILNEDARNAGLSGIVTHQSYWDDFTINAPYDIVLASMTPAIHDRPTIDKMIAASQKYGIYVTWGRYRINQVVNALLRVHHAEEFSSDLSSIETFMERLRHTSFVFQSTTFETSWSDTYSFEEAKVYAYEQLERRNITPDEKSVEACLKEYLHDGHVNVETKAEKAVIVWRVV